MTANYWQLFFLGAGFLLVELAAIARLSVIFGSTWLTSAVVINSILVLVWTANLFVMAKGDLVKSGQRPIYIATLISLLLSGFTHIDDLLNLTDSLPIIGHLLVVIFTLLPICFASLIFPVAFQQSDSSSKALSYNLLGAFFGGLLEYACFYIGNGGLMILSAGLYLLSFVFFMAHLPVSQTGAASRK